MTNNCRSKNPSTCPYHGANGLVEREKKLIAQIKANPSNFESIFNEIFLVRTERELYEKLGGDEINLNNGIVTNYGNVSPVIQTIATKISPFLVKKLSLEHFNDSEGGRVKDIKVEKFINSALKEAKYNTFYETGSHNPGPDIFLTDLPSTVGQRDFAISVKSGVVSVGNILKLSGSRTTKSPTIESKLDFFRTTSPDIYMCLSEVKVAKKLQIENRINYRLSIFSKDLLNFGNPDNWVEDKNGWSRQNPVGPVRKMYISKDMSHQLWFELDLKKDSFVSSTIDFNIRSK